jgi:hypothetical protein
MGAWYAPQLRHEAELVKADLVATLGWSGEEAERFIRRAAQAYGGHFLADAIQTVLHDEFIDTTWPACRLHPNHPYLVRIVGEVVFWACPRDSSLQCPVGKLGEVSPPHS